jgi:hypothetical protein
LTYVTDSRCGFVLGFGLRVRTRRRLAREARLGDAMRQALVAGIALAVFSIAPGADAQTATPRMTVDAVEFGIDSISVTGIVAGDAAASTRTFTTVYGPNDSWKIARVEACHRSLLLALAKPGQYVARIGPEVCEVALAAP